MVISIAGEDFTLLPERAVYWAKRQTLFIADVHLGKTATFRAHAIPLPEGDMEADLQRLSKIIRQTGAERLIILGDLLHAPQGYTATTRETFERWRSQHTELNILLVRGNHDRRAGDPPENWRIQAVNSPFHEVSFVLAHEPFESEQGYVLAGHLHPAVQLTGKGRQMVKLPCFWFRKRSAVLPAFGSFIGHALIKPQVSASDRIFSATPDAVIEVRI
jgi:uncharacterized protein